MIRTQKHPLASIASLVIEQQQQKQQQQQSQRPAPERKKRGTLPALVFESAAAAPPLWFRTSDAVEDGKVFPIQEGDTQFVYE